MNDLARFQRFGKKQESKRNDVKEVWCYTRVGSKDQKDAARLFAEENGYQMVKTFGGTY